MSENMKEFTLIVQNNPNLKEVVRNKDYTWQEIYNEWILDKERFDSTKFVGKKVNLPNDSSKTSEVSADTVSSILNYVKKINPDTLTKSISTAQKVINLLQGFNKQETKTEESNNFFNDKFNDWY